ncbi:related to methylated-DNA--protein-cysteine methyltransferase [Cephalotrichum gorgonifer]|uniref:Methylated-DNA--protein-cysteine methyltransferase n=1 Tax=Cephalotrichum gorgonifer TaxID=2041049 RepID=A0AAE8MZ17_9PEZI|nr:related to methylated-DNA--protein-cysteine methyltransferase [Cephalotrichum gorgonifer]
MATMTVTKAKTTRSVANPVTHASKITKTRPPKSSPAPLPSTTDKNLEPLLSKINSASITPFEKRVYATLLQVRPGHFTTYGAMAAHLSSSPRAIGNAMRRNPFAPAVPCHRVVASGGALGGFKGKWPKDGECDTLTEKRTLLRSEGVKLDGEGKRVIGSPFTGFV